MLIDKINPDGAYTEEYEKRFRDRAAAGEPVFSTIDGIDCVLPEEEVEEIKAEWKKNEEAAAKAEAEKQALKQSAINKLAAIGLTEEEFQALTRSKQ